MHKLEKAFWRGFQKRADELKPTESEAAYYSGNADKVIDLEGALKPMNASTAATNYNDFLSKNIPATTTTRQAILDNIVAPSGQTSEEIRQRAVEYRKNNPNLRFDTTLNPEVRTLPIDLILKNKVLRDPRVAGAYYTPKLTATDTGMIINSKPEVLIKKIYKNYASIPTHEIGHSLQKYTGAPETIYNTVTMSKSTDESVDPSTHPLLRKINSYASENRDEEVASLFALRYMLERNGNKISTAEDARKALDRALLKNTAKIPVTLNTDAQSDAQSYAHSTVLKHAPFVDTNEALASLFGRPDEEVIQNGLNELNVSSSFDKFKKELTPEEQEELLNYIATQLPGYGKVTNNAMMKNYSAG